MSAWDIEADNEGGAYEGREEPVGFLAEVGIPADTPCS
jgi:hypothetical protein